MTCALVHIILRIQRRGELCFDWSRARGCSDSDQLRLWKTRTHSIATNAIARRCWQWRQIRRCSPFAL